jgi:hypothetical protein
MKRVQEHKINILNDVYDYKYIHKGKDQEQDRGDDLAQQNFYLDYDDAKLQALRELNRDEILHGFRFNSKSIELAFEKASQENPKLRRVGSLRRFFPKFNQFRFHNDHIKLFN